MPVTTAAVGDAILLHGWPGLPSDYRRVVPRLEEKGYRVWVPDLHGLGEGFATDIPVALEDATADAHAARTLRQAADAGLSRPVVVGYDIGSRIAQSMAHRDADGDAHAARLEGVAGLVITPSYPGVGDRIHRADMQPVTWYQHFHRSGMAAALIDGDAVRVRSYLASLWASWSADPSLATGDAFDHIVEAYARPGAFAASVDWYTANAGATSAASISHPTEFLWPETDPIFPVAFADRVDEFFSAVCLTFLPGSGHFVPLEAPGEVVAAVDRLAQRAGTAPLDFRP